MSEITNMTDLMQEIVGLKAQLKNAMNKRDEYYDNLNEVLVSNRRLTAHLEEQRVATYQAVQREHAAKQELARCREALLEIADCLVEINLSNYDEDDVVAQNGSVIAAITKAMSTFGPAEEERR